MESATVELARREGIELIRTGSWPALTGSWTPTRADILAAVEAQQCPAVRRPRLKLGHTDARFNGGGDGEPALGWIENLRATDDGNTLVGDQVALPWLSAVQAAAYPDRSIEGNYRHRCDLGHEHPFVVTAVALLGVAPPAVSTLKSVQDLPAMLGVAASQEVPDGAEPVQVTVLAAGDVHTGAMVALIPTAEDAARLAVDGGEPPEELHVTLAYLGETAALGARGKQDVIDGVSTAANGLPQIEAEAFALNVFNPPTNAQRDDGKDRDTCLVLGLSGDPIDAVHDLVTEALREALWSVDVPAPHRPWHAHMTLVYTEDLSQLASLVKRIGPVRFDRIRMAFGGEHIDIPLIPSGDDDMIAASAAIQARIDPIRERVAALPVQASTHRFDEGQHPRDHDGQFTRTTGGMNAPGGKDHSETGSAAPARKVRIREAGGDSMYLEFIDGGMSFRFPYDEDDDVDSNDPDRHVPDHFDTLRLDRDTTAEFGEELDAIASTRDSYVKQAKVVADRLDKLERQGDTGSAEHQAALDAWLEVGGDGQRIVGGELPGQQGTLVYEMRMGTEVTDTELWIGLRPPNADDDWDLHTAAADLAGGILTQSQFKRLKKEVDGSTAVAASALDPAPVLPAAEPEQVTQHEEDSVSLSDDMRSRLGLADDADEAAALAAIDELKTRADKPAEPSPEMIQASAAATEKAQQAEKEKDELRKEVQILASQMKSVSDELAATKAEKAATVKASVFDAAIKEGKIKPADRADWEKDYDEAPGAVARVLASIASGTAVPVMASGVAGPPEPTGSDDEWDEIVSRLDAPKAV